jgi:hypothetical protein
MESGLGIGSNDISETYANEKRSLKFLIFLSLLTLASVSAVACGSPSADKSGLPATVGTTVAATPTAEESASPTSTGVPPTTVDPTVAAVTPTPETTPEYDFSGLEESERSRAERLRLFWNWNTDFNRSTISLNELQLVLPRDRIAPIDDPTFAPVSDAPDYLREEEPVIIVDINGDARAYPLAMLMWHEIVNDTVGEIPVTVTFCPLCNTGITFERVLDGRELTFGTSGMLRNSDLVMWDRQTETLWQQITGEALAGDYAAEERVLKFVPSSIIGWGSFAENYPDGQVMLRFNNEFGVEARPYDSPPYAGYDDIDDHPFLFSGTVDGRLVATSRVLTIDGEIPVAYPFQFLEEQLVVNDLVNDEPVVALFDDGTLSAFKDVLSNDQVAGSVALYSRLVQGNPLTFEVTDSGITDSETGSTWSLTGLAVDGELLGTQLEPVVHANHFWFAWAVFKPETEIRDSLDDLIN